VFLNGCYYADQIQKDDMDRIYKTNEEDAKCTEMFDPETPRKVPLGSQDVEEIILKL
jgi:hypothetical protein